MNGLKDTKNIIRLLSVQNPFTFQEVLDMCHRDVVMSNVMKVYCFQQGIIKFAL